MNKKTARKYGYDKYLSDDFIGVLFTNKMRYSRVQPIIEEYMIKNDYSRRNLEVLFHPGGVKENEEMLTPCNKGIVKFHHSRQHNIEAETLIRLKENEIM